MRGRRRHSARVAWVTSPTWKSGVRRRLNELTAMILPIRSSFIYRLIPATIDTTAMRNVTPIVTPITVKKLFSFWTRMVSQARRTAWSRDTKGRGRGKCARRSGRAEPGREHFALLVGRDESVAQHDDAPRVGRDVRLVRHHDDGLAGAGQALEHAHDLFRRLRVEVAGRLVGEEHGRIVDERAGNGDALALTA